MNNSAFKTDIYLMQNWYALYVNKKIKKQNYKQMFRYNNFSLNKMDNTFG